MNRQYLLLILLLAHTTLWANLHSMKPRQTNTQAKVRHTSTPLTQWQYQMLGDSLWTACTVPSLVQDELIKAGKLPDPHYRANEPLVQWPSQEDWIYRTSFVLSTDALSANKKHFLELDGVDTYADVYINGSHLGCTSNMFLAYRYDITPHITSGENTIIVHIYSPLKRAHAQYLSNGFNYPADNDHAPIRYSPFTRKAPYHYGWDWGMRLVAMGLWRPVRLSSYEEARLDDVSLSTSIVWSKEHQPTEARIEVMPELTLLTPTTGLCYEVTLEDEQGQICAKSRSTDLQKPIMLTVQRPHLWWPNGWGDPYLYRLSVSLRNAQGEELDHWSKHIGIREIKFVNQPDQWGTSFYWEVNKRPIFIRGANYIPGELLLTKRHGKDFERLFDDIIFANMNMIRVWGGGIYEDERFYDEADRRGILIWQDFMFACTAYPSDREFLSLVRQEAEHQVRRLRHHASLALWCGNNEIEEALKYWGWASKYSAEHYQQMRQGYDPLFRKTLPEVVAKLDSQRSYIHSSPMQANWGRPESFGHGDSHYWGLWYGQQPFEIFRSARGMRFVSEFGFQSLPTHALLSSFTLPEDHDLGSEVMRMHQKASTGNQRILEYMEQYYQVPQSFDRLVYVSQVLQARGMAKAIRTLRSQRPVCMGMLYWQLNDVWPALSWSSIDYGQNYKAMHYTTREAYAPIALLAEPLGSDSIAIYVANDQLQALQGGKLSLGLYALGGKEIRQASISIPNCPPNQLTHLSTISTQEWELDLSSRDRVLSISLEFAHHDPIRLEYYPCPTKDLKLEREDVKIEILEQKQGEATLRLSSPVLIKDIWLTLAQQQARFSRNCFDLLPRQEVIVQIRHEQIDAKTPLDLRLMSMNPTVNTMQ